MADGWYHVTARGNERRAIFRDDRDRTHFVELVGELTERFGVRVHAYVLMDNHYHLLVSTPQGGLSAAMQWLGVSYRSGFVGVNSRLLTGWLSTFSVGLAPATAASKTKTKMDVHVRFIARMVSRSLSKSRVG